MKQQVTLTLTAVAAAIGVGCFLRNELRRYLRILELDRHPELVGQTVTAQGNLRALGRSDPVRDGDRRPGGVSPVRVSTADGRWAG